MSVKDVYLGEVNGVVTKCYWNSCHGMSVVEVRHNKGGITKRYDAARVEVITVKKKKGRS